MLLITEMGGKVIHCSGAVISVGNASQHGVTTSQIQTYTLIKFHQFDLWFPWGT